MKWSVFAMSLRVAHDAKPAEVRKRCLRTRTARLWLHVANYSSSNVTVIDGTWFGTPPQLSQSHPQVIRKGRVESPRASGLYFE